jgi:hypothetical protein
MKNNDENNKQEKTTKEWQESIPLAGPFVTIATLIFTWFRYNNIIEERGLAWHDWIQLALIAVIIGCSVIATILSSTKHKEQALNFFFLSIGLIPIYFFINLIRLVIRVMWNWNGEVVSTFLDNVYTSPIDKTILSIVVIIGIVSIINKIVKHAESK